MEEIYSADDFAKAVLFDEFWDRRGCKWVVHSNLGTDQGGWHMLKVFWPSGALGVLYLRPDGKIVNGEGLLVHALNEVFVSACGTTRGL